MYLTKGEIILTEITESDINFVCQIECDRDLWRYEESVPTDQLAVRKKYEERIKQKGKKDRFDFIITLQSDSTKTPIGIAQIWTYVDFRKSWELGYAILPEYCGKGYGKTAVKLLLQLAFEQLGAHKVVGMCNSNNIASSSLMESVGMTREGVFKEELFWQNKWTDQYYYSILEKEYFQTKN